MVQVDQFILCPAMAIASAGEHDPRLQVEEAIGVNGQRRGAWVGQFQGHRGRL